MMTVVNVSDVTEGSCGDLSARPVAVTFGGTRDEEVDRRHGNSTGEAGAPPESWNRALARRGDLDQSTQLCALTCLQAVKYGHAACGLPCSGLGADTHLL